MLSLGIAIQISRWRPSGNSPYRPMPRSFENSDRSAAGVTQNADKIILNFLFFYRNLVKDFQFIDDIGKFIALARKSIFGKSIKLCKIYEIVADSIMRKIECDA